MARTIQTARKSIPRTPAQPQNTKKDQKVELTKTEKPEVKEEANQVKKEDVKLEEAKEDKAEDKYAKNPEEGLKVEVKPKQENKESKTEGKHEEPKAVETIEKQQDQVESIVVREEQKEPEEKVKEKENECFKATNSKNESKIVQKTELPKVQPVKRDETLMNKYPFDLFDVGKLSMASRQKYKAYFNLDCKEEQLDGKIKQHFTYDLKVDPEDVMDKLFMLKREEKFLKPRTRPNRLPM